MTKLEFEDAIWQNVFEHRAIVRNIVGIVVKSFDRIMDSVKEIQTKMDALTKRADAVFSDSKFGSWREWNDANIKLLQKRNAAQREIEKFWKMEDAPKKASAERRLAKVLAEIEENEKERIPSTPTKVFGGQR